MIMLYNWNYYNVIYQLYLNNNFLKDPNYTSSNENYKVWDENCTGWDS